MSTPTLTRKSLFPRITSDLFDKESIFNPRFWNMNGDFPEMELVNRMPSVNITDNENDYRISFAAPGLEKKDFKITFDDSMLTISAEKSEEKSEEKENYTRREFSYNNFSRSFRLPDNCVSEKINAVYENGLLNLIIPKKQSTPKSSARKIEIS
jgi:HSP20 family protein